MPGSRRCQLGAFTREGAEAGRGALAGVAAGSEVAGTSPLGMPAVAVAVAATVSVPARPAWRQVGEVLAVAGAVAAGADAAGADTAGAGAGGQSAGAPVNDSSRQARRSMAESSGGAPG